MHPLKVLIIEDVVLTALSLRNSLEKCGYAITGIARNLSEVRESILQSPPDIALVDIVLEGSDETGIEIAKYVCDQRPIPIIFVTANSEEEQFRKAQSTRPAAYLLKPFKISDVVFNIELAYHNFKATGKNFDHERQIMLPTNGGLELIDVEGVCYLKAAGAYTEVVLADSSSFLVSTGLGQIGQYFQNSSFYRLSRSFIVNIHHIKRIKEGELLLRDGVTKISLPEGSRRELLNRFTVVKTKLAKY